MSMHLHHPSLSLNGKKKGKVKFRNAAEARKSRELDEEWEKLKTKWAVPTKDKKMGKVFEPLHTGGYKLKVPVGRETDRIPSLNGGVDSAAAIKKPIPVYTGNKILGIGTMHKSNAVPIFSDEEAVEISKMRR